MLAIIVVETFAHIAFDAPVAKFLQLNPFLADQLAKNIVKALLLGIKHMEHVTVKGTKQRDSWEKIKHPSMTDAANDAPLNITINVGVSDRLGSQGLIFQRPSSIHGEVKGVVALNDRTGWR